MELFRKLLLLIFFKRQDTKEFSGVKTINLSLFNTNSIIFPEKNSDSIKRYFHIKQKTHGLFCMDRANGVELKFERLLDNGPLDINIA